MAVILSQIVKRNLAARRLSSGVMTVEVSECLRCGHLFYPVHTPVRHCPACKSKLWNQPRQRESGGGRKRTTPRRIGSLIAVRAVAGEARTIQVRNRLVRVKARLNPPTVVHLAALLGVHRNAVSQWIRGQNGMSTKCYKILLELERKVGIS